jgi:NAD dependent epimerase/dehydratase|tara:strand:+ start:9867 stop:10865 length:999 start_codon:yes stop_codon:yes gene_type:complete
VDIRNKKVLVTGSDGFIGSHLVERLLDENCQVKAFVYYNSFNSRGWLDTISEEKLSEIEVFTGDIRDPNGVRIAVKDVDIVFHLAALIGIPFSYHSPDSYVDTNVKGTLNVLQSCRDFNIERVLITSTSEVYGTARYVPIDEKHPRQPQSPYSATKISADAVALSFYNSFKLPVIIARPFNTYGPRQSARAVIPTIITQLANKQREIKLGSLHPTRNLNYVEDVCLGFIALAKCDEAIGREVNIGSGTEISINDLANLIIDIMEVDASVISDENRIRPENSEVERLVCDSSLLRQLTGWKPEITIKEGLIKTIEWFEDEGNLKKLKSEIYNI